MSDDASPWEERERGQFEATEAEFKARISRHWNEVRTSYAEHTKEVEVRFRAHLDEFFQKCLEMAELEAIDKIACALLAGGCNVHQVWPLAAEILAARPSAKEKG